MVRSAIAVVALVVASLALVSAQERPPVSVSHTTLTIEEGFMQVIQFNLDEPIICPSDPTRECAVVITVQNPAPEQVSIDNCVLRWNWDEWDQPRFLRVAAVNDFVDDPSFEEVLVTEPVISRSEFYSGYDAADITIRTKPRRTAQCSGTGDPHYTTFDGAYWHVYFPGRYVLYGSRQREFEIQVATRAYPARHCGFAARDGNDVVVIWACNGVPVPTRRCPAGAGETCKDREWPRISVSGSSRHAQYVVEFSSGAMLRADTRPYYMNIYATAPGQDYGNAYGICGNFDGNRGNDYNVYRTTSQGQLKPEQIPSYDLFEWVPPAQETTRAPVTVSTCEYEEPVFIRPILNRPDAEDITEFIRDINIDEIIENPDIVIGGQPAEDMMNGIPREQALQECAATLVGSNVAVVCEANLPSFSIDEFIDDCADDLEETGDVEFIADALEDMERQCAELASRNQTTWEVDEDNNPVEPNIDVQEGICLHNCFDQGDCVEGLCRCYEGFLGSDCSINTNAEPTITALIEPVCDTVGLSHCDTQLTVAGTNFWNSDGLICRFDDQIVDGFFLGSMEVACAIPILSHRGATEVRRTVSVSLNNGDTWVTADDEFVYFDGICQTCDLMSGECGPNPTSCTIEGVCYLSTAANLDNICQVCSPDDSISEWTWSYVNHAECGPSFPAGSPSVTIAGSAEVDEVIYQFDASNPRVRDDTANTITYSLEGGDGYFNINNDGEVYVVQRVDALEISSSFNNFLRIHAEDSAGNIASTSLVVDVIAANLNPLFNGTYSITVPEDTPVGQLLATVSATDANDDELTYQWLATEDGYADFFAIDEQTGEVTLAHALDYEDKDTFMLILSARDSGGQYHVTEFTVEVTNVNEAPDSITLDPTSIPENSEVGTVVGTITATDPDGTTEFTLTTTSTDFEIDGNSLVTKTANFDYESGMTVYPVMITATDPEGLYYTTTVNVTITDVNEAPYGLMLTDIDVNEETGNFQLREDRAVDQIVAVLEAQDDDAGQTVQCALVMSSPFVEIFVNNLVLVAPLDFETTPTFEITVACVDNGNPIQQSEPQTFTFEVIDVDDGPQDFAIVDDTPIPEDTDVGTVVGTVTAVDPDGGSEFTFAIVGSSVFSIGESLGCSTTDIALTCSAELVLSEELDFETAPVVTILLEATSGGVRGTGEIDIQIANVNEPVTGISWVNGANTVPENAPAGFVVGSLQVVDNDDTTGVSYTVELLTHTDVFAIESIGRRRSVSNVVAQVVVVDSTTLDFEDEANRIIEIQLRVTEPEASPITFTTTIEVTNAPLTLFTNPSSLSVEENSAIGTVVGQVSLSGNDLGFSYATSLQEDGNGAFSINEMNQIVVSGEVNFEDNQRVRLVVAVETDEEPSPTFPVDVTIINVDEAPVIDIADTNVNVGHDIAASSLVVGFTLSDEDINSFVTVSLEPTTDDAELAMALNSVFTLSSSPDAIVTRRTPSSLIETGLYGFTLTAVSGELTTRVSININVHDDCFMNECSEEAQEVCNDLFNSYECCFNEDCINSGSVDFDDRLTIDDSGNPIRDTGDGTDFSSSNGNSAGSTAFIIAGVVGGIVLIAIVVILVVFMSRRRRNDPANLFYSDEKTYNSNPTFRNPNAAVYSEPKYSTTTSATFAPGVSNPLYEWYKPSMDRRDCTDALTAAPVGSFVVRDSQACPGWHMLGVRTQTSVLHEKIRLLPNGHYELLPASNAPQPSFASVPELVNFYTSPRADIPFVLTASASNPMYGLGVNANNATYSQAQFIPTDSNAPVLPLKEGQRAAVAQIAAVNETDGELYTNTDEATQAMISQA